MALRFVLEDLEAIFQYKVLKMLKMLKKEGNITDAVIENMLSWRHSGFSFPFQINKHDHGSVIVNQDFKKPFFIGGYLGFKIKGNNG